MAFLRKLFVVEIILAALLIQVTARQEARFSESLNRMFFDSLYGFPQPFLRASAYRVGENTDDSGDALSARVFACPNRSSKFFSQPRTGVFLWEHDTFYYAPVRSFVKSDYDDDAGEFVTRQTIIFPEDGQRPGNAVDKWLLVFPDTLLRLADTSLAGLTSDGIHGEEHCYLPHLSFLVNLLYIGLVVACGIYLVQGKNFERHPVRWSLLILATQILVVVGLFLLTFIAWRYYIDFCWLYHTLMVLNLMAMVAVVFCVLDWILWFFFGEPTGREKRNRLRNFFLTLVMIAAVLIQVVGFREGGNMGYQGWINFYLQFGFPKPFAMTEAWDWKKKTPDGKRRAEWNRKFYDLMRTERIFEDEAEQRLGKLKRFDPINDPAPSTLSTYLFSPPRHQPPGVDYYYPRTGVFLWEHRKFSPAMNADDNWGNEVHFLPFPLLALDVNPGMPLSREMLLPGLHSEDGGFIMDESFYRSEAYVPWRCLLFDLAYIVLVHACCLFLFRSGHYRKYRWRWNGFFVLALVYVGWGLLKFDGCWSADHCWLYNLLYYINAMAVLMVLLCLGVWVLMALAGAVRRVRRF